jgi:hypothetical protein
MKHKIPILIVMFNRPDFVRLLLNRLEIIEPEIVRIYIDGPRKNNEEDKRLISECLIMCKQINWTKDVEIKIEESNLGIRFGIPKAVSWALDEFDKVIVVEDDLIPHFEAFDFLEWALLQFEKNDEIGHISGYNWVAKDLLKNQNNIGRESNFMESFMWGTWRRSWQTYCDDIFPKKFSLNELKLIYHNCESIFGTLVWIREFINARNSYISTWAYRWQYNIWKLNLKCISPNRNLGSYIGKEQGTHTRFMMVPTEIEPSSILELEKIISSHKSEIAAESYMQRIPNRGNIQGFIKIYLISIVLSFRHCYYSILHALRN